MLSIKITRVVPLHPSSVYLQWEIEAKNTPAGAGTLEMAVYRSESPAGPWTLVSSALTDFYFTDGLSTQKANLRALSRNWYYYVRAVNGVEEANSSAVDLYETSEDILEQREPLPQNYQDFQLAKYRQRLILVRRKILRDLWIVLERAGKGWKFALLKRRHMGTRCTNDDCWDPATRQAMLHDCPVCRGTGWVDGFYNPFYTIAERRPAPVQGERDTTMAQQQVHRFMFLDFPYLEKQDVIVDVENGIRYCIVDVTPTEVKGVRVQQYVTAHRLDRVDSSYGIEVDREAHYSVRIDPQWH